MPGASSKSEELQLQVRLMQAEAKSRLRDAETLTRSIVTSSDSAHLLQLLAFELLLKACLRIHNIQPRRSHSYSKQFRNLPPQVADSIMLTAADRSPGYTNYTELDELLDTWSANFIALRYPYEKYEGMTAEEYLARGRAWVAEGADSANADFVYFPEELVGMIHAFSAEIDRWNAEQELKKDPSDG